MRKKLSFSERATLQIAAVIPAKTSSTQTPLRARVPIQTIEIPTNTPEQEEDTAAAATKAKAAATTMVNITETAPGTSVSSHSSSVVSSSNKDGVQQQQRSNSNSRHRSRRRSRSPFKLFRRLKGSSSNSSSGHRDASGVTSTRDDEEHHQRTIISRSAEPQAATAHVVAPAHYEKEKLQHQQDYTEFTENTATSTASEREARRQQLVVTESHPHALTNSSKRRSTESSTSKTSSSSRKHSGTAAFMRGGTSSSENKNRSKRNKEDNDLAQASSLDTDEDLMEQEAAAAVAAEADAAAGGGRSSKSKSSSSRNNKHSSRKSKKVPRVKESRIVWTKGMQQDYQRHEAAKAAAAAAAEANDSSEKSMSTLTLTATSAASKYQQQYKLYLLLLNPTSKIFELIQLIYAPATTTVGDILKLIPPNATEPALASQQYTGLARPKRSSPHFMNLSMLASNSSANCTLEENNVDQCQGGGLSCGIGHGEILLAIPYGFTPQHVIRLGKQILANPRIQALLHAANPLQKHGHHHQSRHHHRKSSSSRHHHHHAQSEPTAAFGSTEDMTSPASPGGLMRTSSSTMESVQEEYASYSAPPSTPIRGAAVVPDNLKAAATAGVPIVAVTPSPMKNQHHQHALNGYQKTTHEQTTPVHSNAGSCALSRSLPPPDDNCAAAVAQQLQQQHQQQQQRMSLDSFIRVNNQAAAVLVPLPALGGTYEEASVDMSYSSWSQSVDSSFSSLVGTTSMRSSSSLRSAASFRSANGAMTVTRSNSSNGNLGSFRSSSVSTTTAYLTNSRRQRHVKFVKHVKGMALVTFAFMVAFYFVDPAGYAAAHGGGVGGGGNGAAAAETALQLKQGQPLGICGTFQAMIVMFFLVKFQLFLQATPSLEDDGSDANNNGEYQYKCPFLQTTTIAMERIRKQLRRHRRRQQQQRSQKLY